MTRDYAFLSSLLMWRIDDQEKFYWYVVNLAWKHGVRVVPLTEDEERQGVDGLQCLNILRVKESLPIQRKIFVLCHEIGHWLARKKEPSYEQLKTLYQWSIELNYYPSGGTIRRRCDLGTAQQVAYDACEERANVRAYRLIRFMTRNNRFKDQTLWR